MLTELRIHNVAIVEQQNVGFGPGLNVISGETGAGKSIILHALELVLGGRPKAHAIREGAEALEVEALFDLTVLSDSVRAALPDIAQGDELLLSRSINTAGKNKVYVNGRLGSVSLLSEIAARLINICGQGHHMQLLDGAFHLELLDHYANLHELRAEFATVFDAWKEASTALETQRARESRAEERHRELSELVKELSPLGLREGLRAELEAEVRRLGGAERIVAQGEALLELWDGDEGLVALFNRAAAGLDEVGRIDPAFKRHEEQLAELRIGARELRSSIAKELGALDLDGGRLDELRDRLAEVARVERKYKTNDAELARMLTAAEAELGTLEGPGEIRRLEQAVRDTEDRMRALGGKLTAKRVSASKTLAKEVARELADLTMKDATLDVRFTPGAPRREGYESAELLISTNSGQSPKPLRQVASGGELSRITLVLKKLLREQSGVNVLVFDEVDTGISGSVARAVGEKLKSLAAFSQVVCITHLAQVASLADRHLLVGKQGGERTITVVKELDREGRIEEVARMIAGHKVTKAARESARELLEQSAS